MRKRIGSQIFSRDGYESCGRKIVFNKETKMFRLLRRLRRRKPRCFWCELSKPFPYPFENVKKIKTCRACYELFQHMGDVVRRKRRS